MLKKVTLKFKPMVLVVPEEREAIFNTLKGARGWRRTHMHRAHHACMRGSAIGMYVEAWRAKKGQPSPPSAR